MLDSKKDSWHCMSVKVPNSWFCKCSAAPLVYTEGTRACAAWGVRFRQRTWLAYDVLSYIRCRCQVRRALRTFENNKMTWHTRTGAPHCLTDLESVAAGQASTIILLRPEDEKASRAPWVAPDSRGRSAQAASLRSQNPCFPAVNSHSVAVRKHKV